MAIETGVRKRLRGSTTHPLAAAASDSVMVAASKLLTESNKPLVSSTDFDSCRGSLESKAFRPGICLTLLGDFL